MNYELAKRLKEAGFPQEGKGLWIGNVGQINSDSIYPGDSIGIAQEDFVYIPTLSELIYAVRDHPMNRRDVGLYCNGKEWVAWARKTLLDDEGDGDRDCSGSTPEEAVAALYLQLSKK